MDKNFPHQPTWMPAAGVVEETGELFSCILKIDQSKRWGVEPRYAGVDWKAKLIDAIGDCAIYMCSLFNAVGWDFDNCWNSAAQLTVDGRSILGTASDLMQVAVSLARNEFSIQTAEMYIQLLKCVSRMVGVDCDTAVKDTWEEVRQRTRS